MTVSADGPQGSGGVCAQLYLTLRDPMDCSPSSSSVHGVFQAGILEWVAVSYSRGSSPTQGLKLHLLHWQADSLSLGSLFTLCFLLVSPSVSVSVFVRVCS